MKATKKPIKASPQAPTQKTTHTKHAMIPLFIAAVGLLAFMGYSVTQAAPFKEPTQLPPLGQPNFATSEGGGPTVAGSLASVLNVNANAASFLGDVIIGNSALGVNGGRLILANLCFGSPTSPDCRGDWDNIAGTLQAVTNAGRFTTHGLVIDQDGDETTAIGGMAMFGSVLDAALQLSPGPRLQTVDGRVQNLLYGNVHPTTTVGNLLLLQKGFVDKFVVDHNGNTTAAGSINSQSGTKTGNYLIGGVNVMNGALTGDLLNINGVNPAGSFANLIINGLIGLGGSPTAGNRLTVEGNTRMNGNAVVTGTLSAGNTSVNGTLGVTGNTTIGGTLSAGPTTINGTLNAGNTTLGTLSAGATTLGTLTASNTNINGTLGVTGNTTIGGTLSAGATTVTTLNASGTITGANVISQGLLTAGSITTNGTLNAGATTVSSLTASGDIRSTSGIFYGNGSGLTNLPAGNLTGTLSLSRIPACSTNQILKYGSGGWGCAADDDDAYTCLSGSNCTINTTSSSSSTEYDTLDSVLGRGKQSNKGMQLDQPAMQGSLQPNALILNGWSWFRNRVTINDGGSLCLGDPLVPGNCKTSWPTGGGTGGQSLYDVLSIGNASNGLSMHIEGQASGDGGFVSGTGNLTVDNSISTQTLCLQGNCRSTWPSGSGSDNAVTSYSYMVGGTRVSGNALCSLQGKTCMGIVNYRAGSSDDVKWCRDEFQNTDAFGNFIYLTYTCSTPNLINY